MRLQDSGDDLDKFSNGVRPSKYGGLAREANLEKVIQARPCREGPGVDEVRLRCIELPNIKLSTNSKPFLRGWDVVALSELVQLLRIGVVKNVALGHFDAAGHGTLIKTVSHYEAPRSGNSERQSSATFSFIVPVSEALLLADPGIFSCL